jgi:hypothetical protein
MFGSLARFYRDSVKQSSARNLRIGETTSTQELARNAAGQLYSPAPTAESELEALKEAIKSFEFSCSKNVNQCALELALYYVSEKPDNNGNLNDAFTTDDVNTLRALIKVSELNLYDEKPSDEANSFSNFQQNYVNTYNSLLITFNEPQKINRICQAFKIIGNASLNKSLNVMPTEISELLEKICNNESLKKKYPSLVVKLQTKIPENKVCSKSL